MSICKRTRLNKWTHPDSEWIINQYKTIISLAYAQEDGADLFVAVTSLVTKATLTGDNTYITRPLLWLTIVGAEESKGVHSNEVVTDAVALMESWAKDSIERLDETSRQALEAHILAEVHPGVEVARAVYNTFREFKPVAAHSLVSQIFVITAILVVLWNKRGYSASDVARISASAQVLGNITPQRY